MWMGIEREHRDVQLQDGMVMGVLEMTTGAYHEGRRRRSTALPVARVYLDGKRQSSCE